jgi:hypothetical protein
VKAPPDDRREHPRVQSSGTATVARGPGDQSVFAIRDLSTGAVRLVGSARLVEGERVRVSLELDGTTVTCIAEVVRTDPQNQQAALAFRDLSGEGLQAIERAVQRMLESVKGGADVLICHPDTEVAAALQRDLSRLQRSATLCTTPDGIVRAVEAATRAYTAVIASGADQVAIGQIFSDLARHQPDVRRVLLFGDKLEPMDRALSNVVHSVLRTPWRIRALARALGLEATDSSMVLLPAVDPDE